LKLLKVLHLSDEVWDSGLTAYALQVAALLKGAGHEVVVGLRGGKTPIKAASGSGLETREVDSIFDLRRVVREDWDIINVHTGRTHTWAVVFSDLIGKRAKRMSIVRTRGDARPLQVHPLSRLVYRHTSAVIAASEHVKKDYETGFGWGQPKLTTIYPSVAVDHESSAPPVDRVGIIGRLDPVKGHSVYLEAAAHILRSRPQTQFLVAGKEAGVSIQLLKNQATQLGIEKSIKFLGYQDSAQDFMRSCTIGVIASIGSEEISRACLEWMGTGRAVVGTLVGCLSELIEPDETGLLVPPGDALAMAKGILHLLANKTIAETWGKNARALAIRRFSPEIQLRKTLDVYERTLR